MKDQTEKILFAHAEFFKSYLTQAFVKSILFTYSDLTSLPLYNKVISTANEINNYENSESMSLNIKKAVDDFSNYLTESLKEKRFFIGSFSGSYLAFFAKAIELHFVMGD